MDKRKFINQELIKLTILLQLLLICLFSSCYKPKKSEPSLKKCTNNCIEIKISGRVIDGTDSTKGIKDVPIEVSWGYSGIVLFPLPSDKVYKGKADINGNFAISVKVDSSLFNKRTLVISTQQNDEYFIYPDSYYEIFENDPVQFQNLKFVFYSKTTLKLNIRRIKKDRFESYLVEHNFKNPMYFQDYFTYFNDLKYDTTIVVKTSANIYTKIVTTKLLGLGNAEKVTDSIYCNINGNNTYNISY